MNLKKSLAAFFFSWGVALSGCANSPQGVSYDRVLTPSGQTVLVEESSTETFDVNDNFLQKRVIDDLVASTVRIHGGIKFGSGTVLVDQQTETQYILTCSHTASLLSLVKDETKEYGLAFQFKNDPEVDLALLVMSEKHPHPFTGRIAGEMPLGSYLLGVGYPFYDKPTLLEGRINTTPFPEEEYRGIQIIEGMINQGESGGGLYLFQQGKPFLAGIINSYFDGDENTGQVMRIGAVVHVEKVRHFLESTPVADDYL